MCHLKIKVHKILVLVAYELKYSGGSKEIHLLRGLMSVLNDVSG